MVYLKAPNHDFSRLALAIIAAARDKQISVRTVQVYRQPYYYENRRENFTRNPFLDIVRDTYKDTRSKATLNNYLHWKWTRWNIFQVKYYILLQSTSPLDIITIISD